MGLTHVLFASLVYLNWEDSFGQDLDMSLKQNGYLVGNLKIEMGLLYLIIIIIFPHLYCFEVNFISGIYGRIWLLGVNFMNELYFFVSYLDCIKSGFTGKDSFVLVVYIALKMVMF